MMPFITLLPRLRGGLAAALTLAGLVPAVQAQSNGPLASGAGNLFTLKVPVNATAQPASGGEAVKFTGTGTITSRLVREPDTGNHVLLATFDFEGITGVGGLSKTKYQLTAREAMVLPHVGNQSVSLTFPMEPHPSSAVQQLRTGLARLSFAVNLATGEVMGLTASSLAVL